MKLIASLTSPFARKLRVVLLEKAIPFELVVDVPWTDTTEVPRYNPLGKVPVLILEDGRSLYDSRVAAEYLERFGPPLLPADFDARIEVKRWEALSDGMSDASATVFLERKRPAEKRDEAWIARQLGKVDASLAAMERELGARDWCVGDAFTLADLAVVCNLGYLDLRFPEITWRERCPSLARLSERVSERPSMKATLPPA